MSKQQSFSLAGGVTLIELLVALTLGVMLSGAVLTAYLAAKQTYLMEKELWRMQETGRYVARHLARELGTVGFLGGSPVGALQAGPAVSGDCQAGGWALDSAEVLEVLGDYNPAASVNSSPPFFLPCLRSASVLAGTDLVAIKRTAALASVRDGVPEPSLRHSSIARWYLKVDPDGSGAWEKHTTSNLLATSSAVSEASYWRAVAGIYFVRTYAAVKGDGIPSLCRKGLAGGIMTTRCFAEGVENLQIEYGVDRDGDGVPEQYTPRPSAMELSRVTLARLFILLRSLGEFPGHQDRTHYRLGGKVVVAPGDGYIRQVIQTTVPVGGFVDVLG